MSSVHYQPFYCNQRLISSWNSSVWSFYSLRMQFNYIDIDMCMCACVYIYIYIYIYFVEVKNG